MRIVIVGLVLLVAGIARLSAQEYSGGVAVVEVNEGKTLTFAASAESPTATMFQWRRNGVNIPGAVGEKLSLSNITLADSGVYSALAWNAAGSTSSNFVTVVVTSSLLSGAPPIIASQPVDVQTSTYGNATFSVEAIGTSALTYQWFKDGEPVTGATSSSLPLTNVVTNAGYSVVVSSASGSVTSRTAGLSIINSSSFFAVSPPAFTVQPANSVALSSNSVTFVSSASGSPAPNYQWLKNGMVIPGATAASLTIGPVSAGDVATYSVLASNSAGSVVSNGATLTLSSPPVFISQPSSQTAYAGNSVVFSASVTGTPTFRFQWFKNGEALFGATNATLQINAVTKSDEGIYSVGAKNGDGYTASNGASLVVQDVYVPPPAPPPPPPPAPPAEPSTGPIGGTALIVNTLLSLEIGAKRTVDFQVGGNVPRRILVRVMGPTLSAIGMPGGLADPQVYLFGGNSVIAQNDNWGGTSELIQAFNQAGAAPFMSVDSKDAALLATVNPGAYSLLLTAADQASGMLYVEIYELP